MDWQPADRVSSTRNAVYINTLGRLAQLGLGSRSGVFSALNFFTPVFKNMDIYIDTIDKSHW